MGTREGFLVSEPPGCSAGSLTAGVISPATTIAMSSTWQPETSPVVFPKGNRRCHDEESGVCKYPESSGTVLFTTKVTGLVTASVSHGHELYVAAGYFIVGFPSQDYRRNYGEESGVSEDPESSGTDSFNSPEERPFPQGNRRCYDEESGVCKDPDCSGTDLFTTKVTGLVTASVSHGHELYVAAGYFIVGFPSQDYRRRYDEESGVSEDPESSGTDSFNSPEERLS